MLALSLFWRVLFSPAGAAAGGVAALAPLARALGAESETDYERVARAALARMVTVAERYVGSRDEAWDCAQEALIRAIEHFDSFEGRAAVQSWLHRITVNCALQHLRRRGTRNEVSIDDLLPAFDDEGFLVNGYAVSEETAEELLERADTRAIVQRSLDALPESHRTVLLLRDIEELSIREVAAALSLSETAAKVRIHRARSALRKLLEPLMAARAV